MPLQAPYGDFGSRKTPIFKHLKGATLPPSPKELGFRVENAMTKFQFAEEFSFSEARSHLADIANEVIYAGKRAILTRKGKQVVAIVSMEDLEALNAIEDQIDLDDVKKALADVKKHGTISLEAIKRKHKL